MSRWDLQRLFPLQGDATSRDPSRPALRAKMKRLRKVFWIHLFNHQNQERKFLCSRFVMDLTSLLIQVWREKEQETGLGLLSSKMFHQTVFSVQWNSNSFFLQTSGVHQDRCERRERNSKVEERSRRCEPKRASSLERCQCSGEVRETGESEFDPKWCW